MNELVSIIVPVYNVEEYVGQCIESIIKQTYINLQIIIIDDGSTDNSLQICKKYQLSDNRIELYHKENGGLSSARNYGLFYSKGKYVAFIDSDDYISENYVMTLVGCLEETNGSVSMCRFTSDGEFSHTGKYDICSNYEVVEELFNTNGYKFYAWNKLYKADLFINNKYPEGKTYEDITTTYKILKESSKICLCEDVLYFYRVRKNSITNSKYNEKSVCLIEAINQIISDAEINGIVNVKKMLPGYFLYYLSYINLAIVNDVNVNKEIYYLRLKMKPNLRYVWLSKGINNKQKIMVFLFFFLNKVYIRALKKYRVR